ncbi:MAG: hypothetical protein C0467_04750 [Planctomycetaceae bacterium]|nr:hypothetical protein [Planctomycetaceae bacterium]
MSRFALSALNLALLAAPVAANVGPPATGGQVTGEPVGIRHIQIVREKLVIDLRPVARDQKAMVEATYQLQNNGAEQSLDLLFAGGSYEVVEFEVLFDGKPIATKPISGATIPDSWKPPKETPNFGDGQKLDYAPGLRDFKYSVKLVGFSLTVPTGPHTLMVRYSAAAATNWLGQPTRHHQFAYVLAPARSWDGFGGLDVTLHLPEGWIAVVTPQLEREGDTLRGSFEHLPADSIAITFRAPEGRWYRPLIGISQSVFAAVGIAGLIVSWVMGRWRGRRTAQAVNAGQTRIPRIWPWALAIGMLWSVGVFASGLFAVYGAELTLPEGQVVKYGYGQLIEALGVGLLAPHVAVVGFLIAYVTGIIVQRKNLTVPS